MREWLITNGLGGYASLPYSTQNTRKFHGILIASLEPPTKRWVFISNIHDSFQINNTTHHFDPHQDIHFDLFPSYTHHINENTKVTKTFFMPYHQNTTIIQYHVITPMPLTIHHSILLNSRHIYDTTDAQSLKFSSKKSDKGILIKPSNTTQNLRILLNDACYTPQDEWIELKLDTDKQRHDSWIDHCYFHGIFSKDIAEKDTTYYLVLTTESSHRLDPHTLFKKEIQRKQHLIKQANLPQNLTKLILATDRFVVTANTHRSILAGYHWFSIWGRDAMISLPGIALVTKRYKLAQEILQSFHKRCKNGLIPNALMDRDNVAVYNTVDAPLWYIDRVYQYLKYTDDTEFLKKIWHTLHSIQASYQKGTLFNIHMDTDYLISHAPGLTWMDVKIGDYYPTPRAYKAVEIQALWYNALCILSHLAAALGEDDIYAPLAENVQTSFLQSYTHQYDVLDQKDISIRPNKLFLVSLDFSMIPPKLQKNIVMDIEHHLLTLFGLRTLATIDSRYKGQYIGEFNRDIAYHNGMVWPWLLGPYITAFIKTHNYDPKWRDYAYTTFIQPMLEVFGERWDGSIHEIFDGDPPYTPRGCISQAWSVAEILRAWVEDIDGIRPPYESKYAGLHEIRV